MRLPNRRLDFDPVRERAELRNYLGESYDQTLLERYQEVLDEEVAQTGDEHELYRTSRAYLYNLTVFAMSGTKLPYLNELMRVVPPGSRVLDYGCGIGSDGLMLLEAGYQVEFADFANPSTAYLQWRLKQRSLRAPVHDLDKGVPAGFDAAFAFDVIEHVPDAFGFVNAMERRADLVMVNLLEFGPHEQELHYELPIRALLGRAARRRLRVYRTFYGSSHLLAYGRERAGPCGVFLNLSRLAAGRLRSLADSARP